MNRNQDWKALVGAVGLIGLAYMPEVSAAKDEFTIRCREVYESSPGKAEEPFYVCKLLVAPNEVKGIKPLPIDSITFSISEDPNEVNVRACPGWWFINGRWVYDANPPCPGMKEIREAQQAIK